MPPKSKTEKIVMPRIREKSRLMSTHETVVDLFTGRATGKTLQDAFQFGLFGVDFASDFRNLVEYHLEDDLICADEIDSPNPHPRIRQLTVQEAEKHGKELVEEEEKLKDKAENKRLKKLRKKERKRLEKESTTIDSDSSDEEPEEFESSENQKENIAETSSNAAFPSEAGASALKENNDGDDIMEPNKEGDGGEPQRKKERKRLEKESATKDSDSSDEEPEEFKSSENQKENIAETSSNAAFPSEAGASALKENNDGDDIMEPNKEGDGGDPQGVTLKFILNAYVKAEKRRKNKASVQPEEKRPPVPEERSEVVEKRPNGNHVLDKSQKNHYVKAEKRRKNKVSVQPEEKRPPVPEERSEVVEKRPNGNHVLDKEMESGKSKSSGHQGGTIFDVGEEAEECNVAGAIRHEESHVDDADATDGQVKRELDRKLPDSISSVAKTKKLEQNFKPKNGKHKSLSLVKQELKQVTEDRPAVKERREANIIQEDSISSVAKTKKLEQNFKQKNGKQKSLSLVKQELKQVTEDRPAVKERREANIIQEDSISSAAKTKKLEQNFKQKNGKQKSLSLVKQELKQVTEDRPPVKERREANIIQEKKEGVDLVKSKELTNIGMQFAARGLHEDAVKYFTGAIQCNPTEFKSFGNRSFCYEKMQEYEKALSDADVALCMAPNWSKGLFRKGKALFGLKRYYDACLIYEEVLKQDNTCPEAAQELKRVQAMRLMEMGYTWEQSLSALTNHTFDEALEALFGFQVSSLSLSASNDDTHQPREEGGDWPGIQHRRVTGAVDHARLNSQSPPHLRRPRPNLFPVWVGSVMSTITEANLKSLFSRVGFVYSIKMLLDQECAFVNYIRREDSEKAIQLLNGVAYEGVVLSVRYPVNFHPEFGVSHEAGTAPIACPPTSSGVGRTGQIQW